MVPYNKPSSALVWDQINRDNPKLPISLSAANAVLLQGPLTTSLGTSGRNTRAVFNAVQGMGYSGKLEVFYDRLSLEKLFYGITLPTITIPYGASTTWAALDAINAHLGTAFDTSEVSNYAISGATGTLKLYTPTSLAWTNYTVSIPFVRAAPSFTDVWLKPDTTLWEDMAEYNMVYNLSFSPYRDMVGKTGQLLAGNPGDGNAGQNLVAALRKWTGLPFTLNGSLARYDLTNYVSIRKFTYLVPEANQDYEYVTVLTPPDGAKFFQHKYYIHHNYTVTDTPVMSYETYKRYLDITTYPELIADRSIVNNGFGTFTFVESKFTPIPIHPDMMLYGTPYLGVYSAGSSGSWERVSQHCCPTQAIWDENLANGRTQLITPQSVTGVQSGVASARNGYTSLGASIQSGAGRITKFVYYDAAAGGMMTYSPRTAAAPTIWIP